MAKRLLTRDYPVSAYNRTQEKSESLKTSGARIAQSPPEAIADADCVVLMLADMPAIREVLLGEETRSHLSGRTVIQMGTIGPSESRQVEQEVKASGGDYFEAPVLGSIPQAQKGSLILMVGASSKQFQDWSELLKCFGPHPVLIGPVGKAAALKLALNQLIASLTASFALSLGMVQREEIPVETFMQILRGSALYTPTFDKKLSRMVKRDYENPNFPARHLLKDVDLILATAAQLELDTSSLMGIRVLLEKALGQGWADGDYSAVFEAVLSDP
jgi:3-hydroxyisobutyrate dehydrogenase